MSKLTLHQSAMQTVTATMMGNGAIIESVRQNSYGPSARQELTLSAAEIRMLADALPVTRPPSFTPFR